MDKVYYNRQVKIILYKSNNKTYTFDNLNDPKNNSLFNISFQSPFSDDGIPPITTVTILNLSRAHRNLFKTNDTVAVEFRYEKTGRNFELITKGTIKHIQASTTDGIDNTLEFTIQAGKDFSKIDKINSGISSTKTTNKSVKINKKKSIKVKSSKKINLKIAFKKGTKASHIIKRLSSEAKIPIKKMQLKKDKIFKKGYTVNGKPFSVIKSLAKQSGSKVVYDRDKISIINPAQKPNTKKSHLYFNQSTGLIGHPSVNDNEDGKTSWTITVLLNPSITIQTPIEISSPELKGTYFVKSGEHNLDESSATTTIEVTP